MKTFLLAVALLSSLSAFEPEIVVVLSTTNGDVRQIAGYLSQGWTVKHQSAVEGPDIGGVTLIFTLSPPTPQVVAAVAEKRRIAEAARLDALKKKREELLKAKNPPVEK